MDGAESDYREPSHNSLSIYPIINIALPFACMSDLLNVQLAPLVGSSPIQHLHRGPRDCLSLMTLIIQSAPLVYKHHRSVQN